MKIRFAVCWVLQTVVNPDPEVRFGLGVKCHIEYASSSSSKAGPGAYAPDALQPEGLLCSPYVVLTVPTFAAREIQAAKSGSFVGEKLTGNFA